MAWWQTGDKRWPQSMLLILLPHICVTRPRWVNDICGIYHIISQYAGFYFYILKMYLCKISQPWGKLSMWSNCLRGACEISHWCEIFTCNVSRDLRHCEIIVIYFFDASPFTTGKCLNWLAHRITTYNSGAVFFHYVTLQLHLTNGLSWWLTSTELALRQGYEYALKST